MSELINDARVRLLSPSIAGGTAKYMKYHFKDCLEDNSPDALILFHSTNGLKRVQVLL